MAEMTSASAAGLAADEGLVDLNNLQVIKKAPISRSDRAIDKASGEALLRSGYGLTTEDGQLNLPPPPQYSDPGPQAPPPAADAPIPVQAPGLNPNDPPRFQERMNSLYGQKMASDERAAALEARLADTLARIEGRFAQPQAQPQSPPYTNQYNQFPSPTQNSATPPAGDFVSRAELVAQLEQQRQILAAQTAIAQAHTVSRMEAERTFPDVFQNPQLKAAADQIWASDAGLRSDPRGPEKAAAMARGLFYTPSGAPPAQVSQAVRKENLSGIGSSVAEGSAPPNQNQQRYDRALAYARSTNNLADFARARRIALGQE